MKLALFILALCCEAAFGANYYVSTTGSASNSGSSTNAPWSLTAALADNSNGANANHVLVGGDTIWLRGGTYYSGQDSNQVYGLVHGFTTNAPITIRQYPGERAIIQPAMRFNSSNLVLWGFEISNPSTTRTNVNWFRAGGLDLVGPYIRCINLNVHDCGQPGIGFGTTLGDGSEVYGCILWGNGLYDQDPLNNYTRGSGIYGQNQVGTRYVEDNLSFWNFTTGMKAYAESGYSDGFHFVGNINFCNGDGGIECDNPTHPQQGIIVNTNVFWLNGNSPRFGVYSTEGHDISGAGNYWVNQYLPAVSLNYWDSVVWTNNTFVTISQLLSDDSTRSLIAVGNKGPNLVLQSVDRNDYWGGGVYPDGALFAFGTGTWTTHSWAEWKTLLSWETNGVYHPTNLPTSNVIVVRPNKYETGRGHIAVINWASNTTASVDISSVGLTNGQNFRVYDVQNIFGDPVYTNSYSGSSITLPLTNTSITSPLGTYTHMAQPAHTDQRFNAFLVLPGESGTVAPPSSLSVGYLRVGRIIGKH